MLAEIDMSMTLAILFILYAVVLSIALGRAGHRSRATPAIGTARPSPERVLIIGATGGTGRQLVAQALERGYRVTVLVRNPAKLEVEHPSLTVVRGDVLDPETLEAAMLDQEAVLCALGHKRYYPPSRILSTGTINILRAMQTHGVDRLICETSLGVGDSAGRLGLYYTFFVIPVVLPFYYWDKTRQERAIASSGLEWTIVRPGMLTNRPGRGACRHGPRVGSYVWSVRVSRSDVAHFMLDQLETDSYVRSAPGVCW